MQSDQVAAIYMSIIMQILRYKKMTFSIKDVRPNLQFTSLWIWLYLLKRCLLENFIFYTEFHGTLLNYTMQIIMCPICLNKIKILIEFGNISIPQF